MQTLVRCLWGNYRPESIEHLFISIQTFNSQDFTEKTSSNFYDYIIVDEFHHAAAPTYQKLLTYYKPKILLGLTATPERMDGKNILQYFGNRIAAEIRLPEAIDRKLLSPLSLCRKAAIFFLKRRQNSTFMIISVHPLGHEQDLFLVLPILQKIQEKS